MVRVPGALGSGVKKSSAKESGKKRQKGSKDIDIKTDSINGHTARKST